MTELYINDILVDLLDDVTFVLNYQISDITAPDKKGSGYSKTIELPSTPVNDTTLGFLYSVDSFGNFDPRVKAKARLLHDGLQIMAGYARLLKIVTERNKVTYNIALYQSVTDLFSSFSDDYMNELDLTVFAPVQATSSALQNSWIDFNTGLLNSLITVCDGGQDLNNNNITELQVSFRIKTLIDQIFTKYGFKFESNFFDSSEFKRLVLLGGNPIVVSPQEVSAALIELNAGASISVGSANQYKFTNELYNDPVDPSNQVTNTATRSEIRINKAGYYDINHTITVDVGFATFPNRNFSTIVKVEKYDSISNSYKLISQQSYAINTQTSAEPFTIFIQFSEANAYERKGGGSSFKGYRLTIESVGEVGSPITYNYVHDIAYALQQSKPIAVGEFYNPAGYMYTDFTVKDFFKGIITMFNLQVMPDANNEKLLYIEPYPKFYNGDTVDLTENLDYSSKIEQTPISYLTASEYEYKYKDGNDALAVEYRRDFSESYGGLVLPVTNDFSKTRQVTELPFESTVVSDRLANGLAIPSLIKKDANGVISGKVDKWIPRILIYSGNRSTPVSFGADGSVGFYPLVDMVRYPQPNNMNFSGNDQSLNYNIFYRSPLRIYTLGRYSNNNNLYLNYQFNYVDEVTDPQARLVTASFYLSALDISQIDFRNTYLIEDRPYRLQAIKDYNPINNSLCFVDLVRVKNTRVLIAADDTPPDIFAPVGEFTIIEGGLDEVRSITATNDTFYLEGGLNEVRSITATGDIFTVEGNG